VSEEKENIEREEEEKEKRTNQGETTKGKAMRRGNCQGETTEETVEGKLRREMRRGKGK
jgi:hypothetical protein